MDLVRFDPFSLFGELDRFWERGTGPASGWWPRIDAFDREKDLVVRVEVPGVSADDIDITVEDRTLTITGKRQFDETTEDGSYHRREIFSGEFKRTLVLPEGLNTDEISAKTDNGLLEVVIPRRPEVLPRKVKVDVVS
jgi:HSP20 family protein